MGAVLSAQMCFDAGHKLLNNKGLIDIIIRPHLKADESIQCTALGRYKEDGAGD